VAKFNLAERWLIPGRDGICGVSLKQMEEALDALIGTGDWLHTEQFSTKVVGFEIYRTNDEDQLHLLLPSDIYLLLYRGMEIEC
jgi:hypothetical protein